MDVEVRRCQGALCATPTLSTAGADELRLFSLISELNLDANVATLLGGMAIDMVNPFLASALLCEGRRRTLRVLLAPLLSFAVVGAASVASVAASGCGDAATADGVGTATPTAAAAAPADGEASLTWWRRCDARFELRCSRLKLLRRESTPPLPPLLALAAGDSVSRRLARVPSREISNRLSGPVVWISTASNNCASCGTRGSLCTSNQSCIY